jgi:DNA-binding transcriptional ArsR family regulator
LADDEEETYSLMFMSLKHPVRRKILRILDLKPSTFTEILQQIDIESAHLSYHLESLGDLIMKVESGKYALSEIGKAAASAMQRVEEPKEQMTPKFTQTPKSLKTARSAVMLLMALGIAILLTSLFTLSPVSLGSARVQRNMDTDSWIFPPKNATYYSGYFYEGDGLYGVQIRLVFNESFGDMFPLTVRLCTPSQGSQTSDWWNQSWYEWLPSTVSVPGMTEELSVTLLVEENSARIVSDYTFDHVHFSPGTTIGQLNPSNCYILVKVAPELQDRNVTLEGFRAFQITWFYFPVAHHEIQRIMFFSGVVLIASCAVFFAVSEYIYDRKRG